MFYLNIEVINFPINGHSFVMLKKLLELLFMEGRIRQLPPQVSDIFFSLSVSVISYYIWNMSFVFTNIIIVVYKQFMLLKICLWKYLGNINATQINRKSGCTMSKKILPPSSEIQIDVLECNTLLKP